MLAAGIDPGASPIQILRCTSEPGGPEAAPASKVQCSDCRARDLCLPKGLGGLDLERLDGLHVTRRKLRARQTLYRKGDPFHFIYSVRSGTFKSSVTLLDGHEQVMAFHMGGEVMGLDGVAQGEHATTAVALEQAEVCVIPYANLIELAVHSTSLQQIVTRLMSREILREHGQLVVLGSMNAEARLAAFLLNMSQRMRSRGFSPSEFNLRMSRAEIGSYLGVTLETVSRAFSTFQHSGVLEVDKKHVRILDLAALDRAIQLRHE